MEKGKIKAGFTLLNLRIKVCLLMHSTAFQASTCWGFYLSVFLERFGLVLFVVWNKAGFHWEPRTGMYPSGEVSSQLQQTQGVPTCPVECLISKHLSGNCVFTQTAWSWYYLTHNLNIESFCMHSLFTREWHFPLGLKSPLTALEIPLLVWCLSREHIKYLHY